MAEDGLKILSSYLLHPNSCNIGFLPICPDSFFSLTIKSHSRLNWWEYEKLVGLSDTLHILTNKLCFFLIVLLLLLVLFVCFSETRLEYITLNGLDFAV